MGPCSFVANTEGYAICSSFLKDRVKANLVPRYLCVLCRCVVSVLNLNALLGNSDLI